MAFNTPKFLHTMIRVRDLATSISFYHEHFGFELIRRRDFPDQEFTLAYLGHNEEETGNVLELTWNWDQKEKYDLGNGYGHIALGCDELYSFVETLRAAGVKITRDPGQMLDTEIEVAFVEDPDGYKIELLQLPFPAKS